MPVTDAAKEVFQIISANRSPDSYVAGGSLSNVDGPRFSEDIDVFHDDADVTLQCFLADEASLVASGCVVSPLVQPRPGFVRARIRTPSGRTIKVDWAHESSWRFFPVIPDEELGWRLHWADAATNKAIAAASRSEVRDAVDLMHWHMHPLSLGALIWAAVGKDPGFSPDFMLGEVVRNARINPRDVSALDLVSPIDAHEMRRSFVRACSDARLLFERLPVPAVGALFLDSEGCPIEPNPDDPETLSRPHFGQERGAWPQIADLDPPPRP